MWYKASYAPRTTADLRYALMASSWADEMAEEAGMPALNFTALLDDAQANARNGLSSGIDETAMTPGQRRVGSKARVATRQWSHLTSGRRHLQRQHPRRPGRHCNQGSGSSINGALLLLCSLCGQIQDQSLPFPSRGSSPGSSPMLGPSSMASVSPTASTTLLHSAWRKRTSDQA